MILLHIRNRNSTKIILTRKNHLAERIWKCQANNTSTHTQRSQHPRLVPRHSRRHVISGGGRLISAQSFLPAWLRIWAAHRQETSHQHEIAKIHFELFAISIAGWISTERRHDVGVRTSTGREWGSEKIRAEWKRLGAKASAERSDSGRHIIVWARN